MLTSLTTYCLPWVHTHKHGKVQLEWYHCHFNTQIKPCSHLSLLSSLYAHAHTQEGSARMLPMSFQQTPTHLSLLSFLWMRTKSVLVYNTRYGSTKMHFQHTKHSPCFYPAFSLLYIHTHTCMQWHTHTSGQVQTEYYLHVNHSPSFHLPLAYNHNWTKQGSTKKLSTGKYWHALRNSNPYFLWENLPFNTVNHTVYPSQYAFFFRVIISTHAIVTRGAAGQSQHTYRTKFTAVCLQC